MTAGVVHRQLQQRGGRGLRGPVALHDHVAQHAAEEREDLCGERSRAADAQRHFVQPHALLHPVEDQVVEPVVVVAAGEIGLLHLEAVEEEEADDAALVVDLLHHLLVDAVQSDSHAIHTPTVAARR